LNALENAEHATDAEQHDRDHKGVNVALAAVAKGVVLGSFALGLAPTDQ
jgi:hypothetical protein